MVHSGDLFNERESDPVAREPLDQMIRFNASDGDPTERPTALMQDRSVVNGEVNYHRKVNLNESACKAWRKKIGTTLARDLNLDLTKEWYLAGWPQNYELFVHLKGPQYKPRHDLYLYGGPSRFRSANEFYPHARWLLTNPEGKCDCKYCGNTKLQRAINFREGLRPPLPPPSTSQPTQAKPPNQSIPWTIPGVGPSTDRSGPRAHLRRAQGPTGQREKKEAPRINKDLEADIRAKRWFRVGEVVWAHLDPPLRPLQATTDDQQLEWWPAVVQETRLRVETERGTEGKEGDYHIRQTTVYRVRMLALATQYILSEDCLLPYAACIPSPPMIDMVAAVLEHGPSLPQFDANDSFAPIPNPLLTSFSASTPVSDLNPTFENGAAYFAFALQIAGQVGMYWCATDEYQAVLPTHDGTTTFKQVNFQGLWWGHERIWLGDFVRIKPRRIQLVGGDILESSPGAQNRCLFLRITTFYLDDLKDGDGKSIRMPIVSGQLYEVAEEDFVEPLPDQGASKRDASLPLPEPPSGFRFRLITRPSFEIHFCFNVIAGRYYPDILKSPRLNKILTTEHLEQTIKVAANPKAPDTRFVLAVRTLLSLGGLSIGALCATEALFWKEGRSPIFNTAWREAKQELEGFMRSRLAGRDPGAAIPPIPEAVSVKGDMELYPEPLTTTLDGLGWGDGTTEDPIIIDD
ncbi:hypothetical protein FRB93_007883 [Tulasnella sp. JGI-2019a]|nr:hypothetical protein FRB93_007883 [Tulasnella sp. JGI-2019a]